MRISAQLVEAKTGYERWSQTYDRELKDVFAVQTDIAKIVTEALKVTLLPADAARLAARGTASIAAHDALLRGAQLFAQSGDEATFRAALAQYDAAIAADPAYAAAHAGRAATLSAIAGQFETAVQAARTNEAALAAALKAVSLKPDQADTQAALAYVLERGRLDVRGAAAAYERAYRAGPDADVLIRYGIFNVRVGDLSKGLAALNRAVALDPVNPRAWRALGTALYQARRYADALPRLDEALRLSPKLASGHAYRGDALLMLGRLPQARAAYAAETTGWARLTGLAIVEARLGNAAASDAAFAALRQDDTTGYQVAQVLAQRGDRAGALTRLEAAYAARDPGILNLRNDPLLDPLRAEPRFRALLRQLSPA
ncbi:tetratricopeptide repeat protein [Sandaracinobacteroides saxicola]|uniref:tetratricopeptide repeat protein n=1 Tax=Sandaracinobacteroides saxicola TaxID=2759707 RepID=UPI0037DA2006